MRTTIDAAGRVVIPKSMRDAVGLAPGEVDIVLDGAAIRIEPVAGAVVVDRDGWLVVPASGPVITAAQVDELRRAGRR